MHYPNELAPEAPRRRFHKLRIAWSVVWGIACVLLLVLWVRSYWQVEHIFWNGKTKYAGISIYPGEVTLESNDTIFMPLGWSRVVFPIRGNDSTSDDDEPKTIFGFAWLTEDNSITAYIPFWFLTLACAAIAWSAFLPPSLFKRFSLRTLLIATTLIAVVLGIIVWMTRAG
jgi:hypothetical protein